MSDGWLQALSHTAIARAISGDPWCFPSIETSRVLSIATVVGSILLVDLRLLGVASRSQPVSALARELLPYTWTAFAVAVVSGSLLFISKAPTYWANLEFRLEFLRLGLAGLKMLFFHLGAYRRVGQWGPPSAASGCRPGCRPRGLRALHRAVAIGCCLWPLDRLFDLKSARAR